jgi:hypothetical protein
MVYTVDELLHLVDELGARGVTHFRTDNLEFSLGEPPSQVFLDEEEEDVEIEHTPGTPADDILFYSAT